MRRLTRQGMPLTCFRKTELPRSTVRPKRLKTLPCVTASVFCLRYHKGEQEALALLEAQEKFIFCTFDGAALTVLGFMGLAERGLSLEGLLRASGLTKKLARKHTQAFFDEHVTLGQKLRVENFST